MTTVLPGHPVALPVPLKSTTPLKLGPGLSHPAAPTAHTAGTLITDARRNAVYLELDTRRYTPRTHDAVLATVLRSTNDSYICAIASSTAPAAASVQASLPHLAFPQATKKTRPTLHPGDTVYARVSLANKHFDPELECMDPETGKAGGFGVLTGGMAVGVGLGTARRLLGDGKKMRQCVIRAGGEWTGGTGAEVLEELGKSLAFEVAVGRNGRVWVQSADVKTTVLIAKCLLQSEGCTAEEVREMVRAELKDV
ncbi:hypothetical protein EDC01DRAFT_640261 [Geopyxis carbonaria]|nr:hypothetical protein EDC01DRAFT_640261 [Geopyxis carbonaria]